MGLQIDVDLIAILLGALLGSLKASVYFISNKNCFARFVDVLVGLFCGVTLPTHFVNHGSPELSGMLALTGGVSGVMVVEVFMQMVPTIAKETIKAWASKLK